MNKTPLEPASIVIKEKRSEFIARIQTCASQADLTATLRELKKDFHDAAHICWAYRIQLPGGLEEFYSDAGEPAGSAGLPILNALRSTEMVNAMLLVIRYFGGVKLGKRGLIDAYGDAALQVAQQVKTTNYEFRVKYQFSCPLAYFGEAQRLITGAGGNIISDKSAESINWVIDVPGTGLSSLIAELRAVTKGTAKMEKKEQT